MPVTRILGIFTCFPLFSAISTFPRLVVLLCFSWESCHHPFHNLLSAMSKSLKPTLNCSHCIPEVPEFHLTGEPIHLFGPPVSLLLSLYGHVADLQCCVHFKRCSTDSVTRVHVSTLPGAFPTRVIIERGAEFPVPRNRSLYPMVSRVCGI